MTETTRKDANAAAMREDRLDQFLWSVAGDIDRCLREVALDTGNLMRVVSRLLGARGYGEAYPEGGEVPEEEMRLIQSRAKAVMTYVAELPRPLQLAVLGTILTLLAEDGEAASYHPPAPASITVRPN